MSSKAAVGGFTLIEVLVAMVILAVGLLALEALGISAARSVAQANWRDQYASKATAELEQAVYLIRTGTMPSSKCETLRGGDKLSVSVDGTTMPSTPVVTVQVIPDPNSWRASIAPYVVSSSVYSANPLTGGGGSACA